MALSATPMALLGERNGLHTRRTPWSKCTLPQTSPTMQAVCVRTLGGSSAWSNPMGDWDKISLKCLISITKLYFKAFFFLYDNTDTSLHWNSSKTHFIILRRKYMVFHGEDVMTSAILRQIGDFITSKFNLHASDNAKIFREIISHAIKSESAVISFYPGWWFW